MRRKVTIRCAILVALLVVSLPILLLIAGRTRIGHQAQADYLRLLKSGSTHVTMSYPDLLDRISTDEQLADRINSVFLLSIKPDQDYASLSQLPHVEELEVMYAEDVAAIVPAINQMPSLKHASFYHCGTNYNWLSELKNPTLESLEIHTYQKEQVSAADVNTCQDNMPACTITVTDDDE